MHTLPAHYRRCFFCQPAACADLFIIVWSVLFLAACTTTGVREQEVTAPPTWAHPLSAGAVTADHGMVASDAPLATHVGVEVLRAGGNAVDATVATAFALAVVHPAAGNIGGGGFIVIRFSDGSAAALDFRETAPHAATRDMYLDSLGNPTDRSVTGHLAAGVPGSVAGLWAVHHTYGVRPWGDLLAPAIRLASEGFPVDGRFIESVREDSVRLIRFPASEALFLPHGRPPAEGTLWRNRDLAQTLQRIADQGPQGFYDGKTADLIAREMARGGGIITRDDLARYEPKWREPIESTYRGWKILSMPPPSSGGITVALIANILESYDLRAMGWHSPDALHVTAEAMRRAFADRNHYLGDPDVVEMPVAMLLSKSYAAGRSASISMDRATPSREVLPGHAGESMHTTHFSVVDGKGNAVAMTTTINLGFGSAVTVTGAGFLLNDEMDDFATKPGSPNAFGLVQGEANAIAPGKRILSSMAPTIAVDPQGTTLLVTGASGGPRIITAVFQVISNVVDYDFDIASAVSAPRIHHQHLPDFIRYEGGGFTAAQLAALKARGHALEETDHLGIAASILRRNGVLQGMADPRTQGGAEGY